MIENRPNPDALLAAVKKAEAQTGRGRLKVFFGMAAGVGKTFAMLQDAHERLREGVDVVVAYVETHGRAETAELLADLPVMPRKLMPYRETMLEEMDLEAVLARKPQLALVDERARCTPSATTTSSICSTPASTSTRPSTSSISSRAPTPSDRSRASPCMRRCPTRSSTSRTRSS